MSLINALRVSGRLNPSSYSLLNTVINDLPYELGRPLTDEEVDKIKAADRRDYSAVAWLEERCLFEKILRIIARYSFK